MNYYKRICCFILSLLLVFSMLGSTFAIHAFAATNPALSAESKTVTTSEQFTVTVSLANATTVYGGNFTLQYDSSLLTADSYQFGSIASEHTKNCNLDYQSAGNLIRVTFSGASALSSSGTLVTLTFTAKSEGTATLQFNAYNMYDENGSSIDTTASNGSVTVEEDVDDGGSDDIDLTGEFAGGSGTESDPYLIATKTQLDNVRNYLDACFKLTNDIVFEDSDFAEGGDFYNDGAGFVPIGLDNGNSFSGIFDGDGYAIKNLKISITSDDGYVYAGLFEHNNGTIKNIGIADGEVSASSLEYSAFVGGIVGTNYGIIENCYNTGKVIGEYAGGIAEENDGTIINCHNTGSVTGVYDAGGIVVYNDDGNITNCYNTGSVAGDNGAGGIARRNYCGAIENCYNTGSVIGDYAGGIAGEGDYGTISNCYNTGTVSAETAYSYDDAYAGGIIGDNSGDISYCYNTGYISAISTVSFSSSLPDVYAGGIAGKNNENWIISNCYNTGEIFASYESVAYAFYGGIVGYNEHKVKYCYNIGYLLMTPEYYSNIYGAGITGYNNGETLCCYYLDNISIGVGTGIDASTKCTFDEMNSEATFEGFDFEEIWTYDNTLQISTPVLKNVKYLENENTTSFAGGFGTVDRPFLVSTKTHLNNVRKYLYAHFKLINNIEFTQSDFSEGGDFYSQWGNAGRSFIPIGTDSSDLYKNDAFTGTFDGNGFFIKNLYISTDTLVIGLFGYNKGTIKNLGMIDGDLETLNDYVGSIAGRNRGLITNCYNMGSVTGNNAGGIVGQNDYDGTIENCYNTGSVTGDYRAGGIAGDNYDGTIKNCYNTGNGISRYGDTGGITGCNTGTITNCYNTGEVSALSSDDHAGGIVGYNGDGIITNCYNTGDVSNSSSESCAYAGGIVGYKYSGTITNCYYLDNISIGVGSGTDTSIKCTESQMQQAATYSGFDFEEVWTLDSEIYSYPRIKTINYDLHEHVFDNDCDTSCSDCGYMRAPKHNTALQHDENAHFDRCTRCGAVLNAAEHIYDDVCDTTCNGCDFTRTAPHSFKKRYDEFEHFDRCTLCRIETNVEDHYYDDVCDTTCNGCEYTRTVTHDYASGYDDNVHFKKCSLCGEITDESSHNFDNDCDTTCNECSFTRTASHSFVQRYDNYEHYDKCSACRVETNAQEHYYDNACDMTCNGCDYTRSIIHSFAPAYDDHEHFEKCTICGQIQGSAEHIYDNDCDTTCNSCEYTRTIQHSYTNSCDESCDICGELRDVTHSYTFSYDDNGHFEKCTVCGNVVNQTEHTYDDVCDSTCNDCDFERTAPHSYKQRYDNFEHYDKCSVCRTEINIEEHYFDNDCDTTCNGCSYTRTTEHAWGEYIYNEDATTTADGTETRTCSSCGETETQTKVGSKLPEVSDDPTYRPNEHMPFLTLNDAGNGVVLDHNKSWATRVYWGCIGDTQVEYKWFDEDFRLLCGTDYFADYSPKAGETYNFTKPGWYRFVVKGIRTGTTVEDYTYSELVYDFYYDGTNAPTVPTITELGNNQVKINTNGTAIKKFYYGNIGEVNTPYSWFNSFWGTALGTKTYTPVFDNRDERIITLQTKGYYNIIIVDTNNNEYVYTVYADSNAPVIKKADNTAVVDIDLLKGNVGTKATMTKLYYGYLGTEDVEISTWNEFTANVPKRVAASNVAQGTTYNLANKGYYKFYVVMALSNGKTIETVYTVDNN